ncbi:hypothetical protein [Sedimenticola selenatireducens]|uniref:Uncharacterized protein n=1 Tax=Sedimenticola selenatireducens TaxID=191960 RepID=A0A2N6CWF5_9GAMM|nr:hypothetical protein [Sedimenticola selenatireducens]PLX61558.1 MAG: hypothetical protein C0630_10345 [Sedimenticola selenatireducens]
MEIDEYFSQTKRINEQLTRIADRTARMALAKSAHTDNPEFVELMKEHQLTQKNIELHKQLIESYPELDI